MAADILARSSFSSTSPSVVESGVAVGFDPENVGVFRMDWKKSNFHFSHSFTI